MRRRPLEQNGVWPLEYVVQALGVAQSRKRLRRSPPLSEASEPMDCSE